MNPALKRALAVGALAAIGYGVYTTQRNPMQSAAPRAPSVSSSSSFSSSSSQPLAAICVLHPDNSSGVSGVVNFRQSSASTPVEITAKVTGLKDGLHGFHIHEYGNLTQGCTTAGAHYNPEGMTHGDLTDTVRHVGDMGNIASKNNVATYSAVDKLNKIQLSGDRSVIGRSVIVHADQDDLGKGGFEDSKTTGHAGARLACGVIGVNKV